MKSFPNTITSIRVHRFADQIALFASYEDSEGKKQSTPTLYLHPSIAIRLADVLGEFEGDVACIPFSESPLNTTPISNNEDYDSNLISKRDGTVAVVRKCGKTEMTSKQLRKDGKKS